MWGSSRPTSIQKTLATRRQGTFPCLNCAACSNVIKSDNITHPRTGKSFPIKGFHTCNSNFVVYLVKCPCGLLYVGETTQHVRDRIASHKSTIRCNKNWLPIPEHFSKSGHSVAQLRFQVIEHVPRPPVGVAIIELDLSSNHDAILCSRILALRNLYPFRFKSLLIVDKVTGSNEFLRTPAQELRTRDYEKERRKLISYDLHCTTLAEYHRQSKIPRGLRSNLRPTLFSDNPDYCEKYKRILNKCSLDIILLTIEYLQKTIVETKQSIQAIEAQFSTALSSTEWTSLKSKTEKSLTEHQKSLQERKSQKFQRDTEDYSLNKVYKWNDTSANTGPWRRPRNQRRYGSFSSGSDSSTTSGRQHFLSKGRKGGQPTTDPPGDQGERMATRSQYNPPRIYHATETFISLVDREVKQFSHQQQLGFYPVHSNLSLVEKQALSSLQNNKNITIKPADKGGAIVVMNHTDYNKEVIRQLSDSNTYGIIQRDPVTNITTKIKSLLNDYLDRHTRLTRKLLPFSSTPTPSHRFSIFYPKSTNTGHFLRIIQHLGTVPTESILVTLDVNSLYTSITHDKGIEATKFLLESSDMSVDSIQFCLDLLDIVLRENYFLFEDTFYVQRCGTAMGANVAPAYANAYMNFFEINYVFSNDLFSQFCLGISSVYR
ncbi:unnamed protein product [Ranitomeya imitator]|uniref:GIY-YIG domain-containing protein n=1 Tax=Ranitomeya imitator TaxID=111125 RepID=A0ABN9MD04_9NEOB|nr:unnamed protein product [Ranitomeya imitator]